MLDHDQVKSQATRYLWKFWKHLS